MSEPRRLSPADVQSKLQAGGGTLLVCAYPSEAAFRKSALEGAISFGEFLRRKPALDRATEIVFY